jgi:glucans biosynthesis protein
VATRTGLGGVVGQKRNEYALRFAADFAGGDLAMLDPSVKVETIVTASRGRIELVSARPLASVKGYRAMFDIVPGEDTSPIALRLFLRAGNQALSETWLYEWSPPPVSARVLY